MEKVSYNHPAFSDNSNHFNTIAKIYEEKLEEDKKTKKIETVYISMIY